MGQTNTSIRGLQIRDAFFGAGLGRNGVDGNIMDIKVDDSTVEIDTDALRVKDDGITNAKLANIAQGSVKVGGGSDAPTDLDAKTDGYILIGDGTDIASVAVSGDITITNAGVTAIGATKVTDAMINDDVATGLAGTGLTATAGVLSVDAITDNIVEGDIKKDDFTADIDVSGYSGEHTLSFTPIANSLQLFLNGVLQEEGSGKDYTLTGTTIQFADQPESGDKIVAHYILND